MSDAFMDNRALILFVAEGNAVMGMGHLMRCLTLAEAFASLGCAYAFRTEDPAGAAFLDRRGVPRWSADLPHPALVVADNYAYTEADLRALRAQYDAPLLYMDDLLRFDPPADMVVNYDPLTPEEEARYVTPSVKLLGLAYTPLRPAFARLSSMDLPARSGIFVSTGASDGPGLLPALLTALTQRFPGLPLHLLTGSVNPNLPALYQMEKERAEITVHVDVADPSALMNTCAYAVTGGGTTLYELCALGIPSVSLSVSPAQTEGLSRMQARGLTVCAEDPTAGAPAASAADALALRMARLGSPDSTSYRSASLELKRAIDGQGARRIAAAALSHLP